MTDERHSSVAGQPATSDTAGALHSVPLPPGWDEAVRLDEDPATIPDPASVEVPAELRAEVERRMAMYPEHHSAVLPALAAAQQVHGWCSPEAIEQVAAVMQVTPAYLSSVATFYDMLRTQPLGSHYLYVCTGVACHLRNAKAVYESIEAQAGEQGLEDWEVREFECLGACDMAPMASIDGRFIGPIEEGDAGELVTALNEGRQPFPGRGLSDPGFRLPWADGGAAPDRPGPPEQPDVHPAGGTWKDAEVLDMPPAEGPSPHPRPLLKPLDPGTSEVPEPDEEP
ncbi:MAG: NAD(P)H-dependent oxidoreductase subunit E [Thermoleophilaceae bacterium]|nr:NAD(P)H-dependent oxidoreductase subunit E [Thermoleophilaceae bacterium]